MNLFYLYLFPLPIDEAVCFITPILDLCRLAENVNSNYIFLLLTNYSQEYLEKKAFFVLEIIFETVSFKNVALCSSSVRMVPSATAAPSPRPTPGVGENQDGEKQEAVCALAVGPVS